VRWPRPDALTARVDWKPAPAAAAAEALEIETVGELLEHLPRDTGEAVGFVDEELVAWGGPESTLGVVLEQLSDDAELVTCIEGDGAPLSAASVRRLVPDGVELELSDGGQPAWWWLISAE